MEPCSEHRCPACRRNPVEDPRAVCPECLAAFGPHVRRAGREASAEAFAAEVAAGDRRVAEVLAERRTMIPLEAG